MKPGFWLAFAFEILRPLMTGNQHTKIDDELDNLKNGNVLLPPDADTASTLEVVPVHHNMDGQVEGDRNPRNRCQSNQLSPAQQSGGAVVVGVEESQWLLLQDKEDSVKEFEVLVEVVELVQLSVVGIYPYTHVETYIVQNNQGLSPATIVVADSIKDTMVVEGRNKLFKEENKQNSTHGCKDEVMDHEKSVEFESRKVLHYFPTTKDNSIVCDQGNGSFFESGHGRLSIHEAEIICRISDDGVESLVEVRP